jgi:hypothetical protein
VQGDRDVGAGQVGHLEPLADRADLEAQQLPGDVQSGALVGVTHDRELQPGAGVGGDRDVRARPDRGPSALVAREGPREAAAQRGHRRDDDGGEPDRDLLGLGVPA